MKTKRLEEYKLQRTVSGGKPHSFIHSFSYQTCFEDLLSAEHRPHPNG